MAHAVMQALQADPALSWHSCRAREIRRVEEQLKGASATRASCSRPYTERWT